MTIRHNYGGAFDIDPEEFFTKEDLVDFAYEVAERVEQKSQEVQSVDIEDVYIQDINNNFLVLQLLITNGSDDEFIEETYAVLDMRKIRKPSDLVEKYADQFADEIVAKFEKDSATNPMSFICPKCGNKTLYNIDNDVYDARDVNYHDCFVCEECGAELLSEPQYDGTINFVDND